MRIFITGVAGFIGSNLAKRLIKEGYNVVGFDNLSQGNLRNIKEIINDSNFSFIKGDIMSKEDVEKAAEGCSAIYHLAAFKIPRYTDALDTLRINAFGTDNVAQVAANLKTKLIAASTSDVYGKNPNVPFRESDDLIMGGPTVRRWAYAISKMFDEQLLFAYQERYCIDVVPVRFFGGYGPAQHLTWWGGPQSSFIDKTLLNEELELHGDGQQTRSFTFIEDHVEGLFRILTIPEAKNQVFNLGSTEEVTIEHLAKTIWTLIRPQEEPKIKIIPYTTFGNYEDVRRRVPDITHSESILNFRAQTKLVDGLKQTITWQKNLRNEIGFS